MEELLKKIGLTMGETKVYLALIKLKKSSIGNIIKISKISASKVYVILDKLLEKGFVSFIIENNVRHFSPTNPKNILDYVEKQKSDLEVLKKESETLVKNLSLEFSKYSEESAQIYKGYPGLRVAFDNILSELKGNEEYLFFSVSKEEFTEKSQAFFDRVQQIRKERNLSARGIIDNNLKNYDSQFKKRKKYSFKFYSLNLPTAIIIGNNRILLPIFGESPIAFEIVSKRIAQKYKNYFYKLWDTIK